MKILAIDSCTKAATGAIYCDGGLVGEFVLNNKVTHSQKLLPHIEFMMQNAQLEFSDIDIFAVTTGPGSFTGERIGVATAKALAHATGKQMVGVSSLMALAYNVRFCDFLICPIMDARRQQVYTATYKWVGEELKTIKEDRAMALSELLDEFDEDVVFLGDGVLSFSDIIKEKLGNNAHFAPPNLLDIRGGSVALCAYDKYKKGKVCDYSRLVPSYLRLSQAEREYNDRNRG